MGGGVLPTDYFIKALVLADSLTWQKGTDLLSEQIAGFQSVPSASTSDPRVASSAGKEVELGSASRSGRLVPGSMTICTRSRQDPRLTVDDKSAPKAHAVEAGDYRLATDTCSSRAVLVTSRCDA